MKTGDTLKLFKKYWELSWDFLARLIQEVGGETGKAGAPAGGGEKEVGRGAEEAGRREEGLGG